MEPLLHKCGFCDYKTRFYSYFLRHVSSHEYLPHFSISCNVAGCLKLYHKVASLRVHLSKRHKIRLNNKCVTNRDFSSDFNGEEDGSVLPFVDDFPDIFCDTENIIECEINDEVVEDFKVKIANILLSLREKQGVSDKACVSTVQSFNELIKISIENCHQAIKRRLPDVNDYQANEILNSFYEMEASLCSLDSVAKQNTYFKDLGFIAPVEIQHDNGTTSMYVPVLKTLKSLLHHNDILGYVFDKVKNKASSIISDFADGTAYKSNLLFSQNCPTIQINLYIDDFQIVAPIGNKTRKHKLCAVYFTLGNIPPKHNSKLHSIQLLLLATSSNVKKYGLSNVLSQFITDMKLLEMTGISITYKNETHTLAGTISRIIADNLAAHEVSGLIESFNSLRICRFCCCTKEQMQTAFSHELLKKRDSNMHKDMLNMINMNSNLSTLYGVKSDSPFNNLKYFHTIWGCPSDVAHDIFEGFALDVLYMIVKHCISKKYFDLKLLNDRIQNFSYIGAHRRNKPVKLFGNDKHFSIKQTAAECKCLVQILPLLIGDLVPDADEHWVVYVQFLEMIDYILAPSLTKGQIHYFSSFIKQFLNDFKTLDGSSHIKPKTHYIVHYAAQFLAFGPLIHSCTLRFEAKHAYFKNIMCRSKNYINPCKTLANKHQYLQCLYHQSKNYLADGETEFKKLSHMSMDDLEPTIAEQIAILCDLTDIGQLTMSKELIYNGLTYSEKYVVIYTYNSEYKFARIKGIFSAKDDIYLIVNALDIEQFSVHLHAYFLINSGYTIIQKINSLLSPFPIPVYERNSKQVVILPHFVQYENEA